jgi:5'-3' exonuclease
MIIIDFNQVCISNLMMQIGNHTNLAIEEDLVRHMILNSLRLYNQKFGKIYGQIVIACDDKNYWRKEIFPYYKAGRKKSREQSDIDWPLVFETLNKIRDEVKQSLPYIVVQVDNCEADDIIATICLNTTEDVLILSADKDFIQLHSERVIQFDPIRKRNVQVEDPKLYLKELVIKGDSGDGIPNVMSSDNCFVESIRQRPINKQKLSMWLELSFDEIAQRYPETKQGIERNNKLINLNEIPERISSKIWDEYQKQIATPKKVNIIEYLQKHKLKVLMEHAGDFV